MFNSVYLGGFLSCCSEKKMVFFLCQLELNERSITEITHSTRHSAPLASFIAFFAKLSYLNFRVSQVVECEYLADELKGAPQNEIRITFKEMLIERLQDDE